MKTLTAAATVVFVLGAGVVWAQKPVRESEVFVDYAPPPATPAAMADAADAVVLAKFTGAAKSIASDFDPSDLWTEYTFTVTDILKLESHLPFAGSALTIRLVGGDRELPSHVERKRDRSLRPLLDGDSYLLYLKWNARQDRFVPAWGPRGMFDVTDGVVTSLDNKATEHDGKKADSFVQAARKPR